MSHESVWDYLETLANSHTRSWERGSRGGHDLCLVGNPLPLSHLPVLLPCLLSEIKLSAHRMDLCIPAADHISVTSVALCCKS